MSLPLATGKSALNQDERAALVELCAREGAELRFDEPMARHTTLRIGGPVDAMVFPTHADTVARLREFCAAQHIPCGPAGAGTNLLVRDGGVRGVLLASDALRLLSFESVSAGVEVSTGALATAPTRVRVGAGVSTGKLLSEAVRRGLGGVEFLAGVPGSVGGGLVMNAGTVLGEFTSITRAVRTVDPRGESRWLDHAACGFRYRGSDIPADHMIVEGELQLLPRALAEIEADVRALRERRREREPHGVPNAGSTFKNPPGEFAGRLLEAAGLKGRKLGGAEISPVHANWIVNSGGATAADFMGLVEIARAEVHARSGVLLELEVKVVGEA